MTFTSRRYISRVCAALVLLAGCDGSRTATNGATVAPDAVRPAATSVPSCVGQRTTSKYGELTARLKRTGGSLCIPAYGGFGGSNLYDEPQLGNSGAPMVYINLHFHRGTHFGNRVQSNAGLTSAAIVPGDSYTAYGIVGVGHLILRFPPCYSVAVSGPDGGIFPNLGNLFNEITITGAGYGVIEIYSGEQVSQTC
jgi:hypothetical protein